MPFDPSRWMTQRHSHPRIGPAYQAPIPDCIRDVSESPRVPAEWLEGPCGIPNGIASKTDGSVDRGPRVHARIAGSQAAEGRCVDTRKEEKEETEEKGGKADGDEERRRRPACVAGLSEEFVSHLAGRQRRNSAGVAGGSGVRTPQEARGQPEESAGSATLLTGGDIEAAFGGLLGEGDAEVEDEDFAEKTESDSKTVLTTGRGHAQFTTWPSSGRLSGEASASTGGDALDASGTGGESSLAASLHVEISVSAQAADEEGAEFVRPPDAAEALLSVSADAHRPEQFGGDSPRQPGGQTEDETGGRFLEEKQSVNARESTARGELGSALVTEATSSEGRGGASSQLKHACEQNCGKKEGEPESKRPRLNQEEGGEGEYA
ncbi:hypothetical protein TGME49_202890 [Toxoplasma gondii ME49]|uniref:Uncharacterized protein n=1 Tax=Toxoplasma gondii (strain ATCC 50611 / Me49) TaxID=508771 RepID=S8GNN9_TOXGM|nr:hypothetical protein TGME49_202890 [Toxoplasma gondii ME49]EPT30179.1 hypothetical protein TGME49_202890 [Toxoplasma gondii ME49]|eukprot:XP_002367572.1 hypothetical protein TGME49_202890 [Toxoplasma gondii ME49]